MMTDFENVSSYGIGSTSYLAAGEKAGLEKLASAFYKIMDTNPIAKKIRDMHRDDLEYMTERLALFLCAWLGGPKDWFTVYNYPALPTLHLEFVINTQEKEAWLMCMDKAIELQNWDKEFKIYLKTQFRRPAEVIQRISKS